MIKVLIAEDSPTIRALLKMMLESSDDIEVIDTAANGREAVTKTVQQKPDLITMDIRMPVMDGFEATKEIMRLAPTPIVVVSASVNSDDLNITFNAIQAGALDIVEKPRGGTRQDYAELAERLTRKIKVMAGVKVFHHLARGGRTHKPAANADSNKREMVRIEQQVKVICIASSTGGPGALAKILGSLPGNFSLPIVIVQHITQGFGEGFVNWLNASCDLEVRNARPGEKMQAGVVYIAPDDQHLLFAQNGAFRTTKSSPVSGLRPFASFLFSSAAEAFGNKVAGVVLTGMGRDGSEGLQAIYGRDGITIAQSESTCVVYGMPKEAVALGVVKHVVDLDDMPAMFMQLAEKEG